MFDRRRSSDEQQLQNDSSNGLFSKGCAMFEEIDGLDDQDVNLSSEKILSSDRMSLRRSLADIPIDNSYNVKSCHESIEFTQDDLANLPMTPDVNESTNNIDGNAGGDNKSYNERGDVCCPCTGCLCSCHASFSDGVVDKDDERPIDSYVVYLFDYELFTVAQNYQKFELLLEYLKDENIFDRSYVVSTVSDRLRDSYSISSSAGARSTDSRLERCVYDTNVLRYRPSIVESVNDTRSDIRQQFRGLIVQGSTHDWYNVRAALNFPAFLIYVRLASSKNDLAADHIILVNWQQKSFVATRGSYGYKIARILAHERTKYFGIHPYNFEPLVKHVSFLSLQRRNFPTDAETVSTNVEKRMSRKNEFEN